MNELGSREIQVLQCLANGMPRKQIASHMGISISTVYAFISRSCKKLLANTSEEAVAICTAAKIIRVNSYSNIYPEGKDTIILGED